jgi:hypothetical protein
MKDADTSSSATAGPPACVFLHEGDDCDVVDFGSSVQLTLKGAWTPTCGQLARKFGVQSVDASRIWGWQGESIEFLDELPGLRSVVIGASSKLDWRPLERQTDLEAARVYSDVDDQSEINFTRFPRLRKVALRWIPQFDSYRDCTWLKSLEVFSTENLRELDLGRLAELEELNLETCSQLHHVELAEPAVLRSLRVSNCPRLQLDLKRFVRDLESLWLQGSVAYRLDDLALGKRLKTLTFTFVKSKGRIPRFMDKLPNLTEAVAVGTRLSPPDKKMMSAFAARRREALEARKQQAGGEA